MNTAVRKRFVYITSVIQFYQRYPAENISLTISEKLFPDVFHDFHRYPDILLRISRLLAKYLCHFVHTFQENTILL